jgi:uncharacterized protein
VIVVDTGPLYASVDRRDAHHDVCAALFRDPSDQLVVPVSVVVEVSFLIERHLGSEAEATFLESLPVSGVTLESLLPGDVARAAELVRVYADLPLGAVDASVVAIAERLDSTTVLTLDRRGPPAAPIRSLG